MEISKTELYDISSMYGGKSLFRAYNHSRNTNQPKLSEYLSLLSRFFVYKLTF